MKLASFRIVLSLLRAPPKQFCAFPVEITHRLFANLSNWSKPARDFEYSLPSNLRSSDLTAEKNDFKRYFFLLIFKSSAGVRSIQNFHKQR